MGILKAIGTAALVWVIARVAHRFLFGGDADLWT